MGSFYPPHGFVGRGTMRSLVEGFWTLAQENPSTTFGGPPPQQLLGRI
jgi:hypothetical protein